MIGPVGTSENSPAIYCRERFASAVIPAIHCRDDFADKYPLIYFSVYSQRVRSAEIPFRHFRSLQKSVPKRNFGTPDKIPENLCAEKEFRHSG